MDRFRAWMIRRNEDAGTQEVGLAELTPADLMDGDVDVRVEHTTVNYKDGLAITGKLPVVRRFPMIPGVDLAGTVLNSTNPRFQPGDHVLLNGWGVGEAHYGGYSQMARLNGDWLLPLPDGLTGAQAMAVGTAGYTAMLAIIALERHGLTPSSGPVVVTGAAGGVGSMSVALLAGLGHTVHAVTGRTGEADYLSRLGAVEIIPRDEVSGKPRLLGKERWAAAIDGVGDAVLANVLSMLRRGGAVAACGNAGGMELPTSVAPFILRGVALLGIDSVLASFEARMEAWRRIAADLDRDKLAAMSRTIGFDDLERAARDIVDGKVRGRLVVEVD